MTKIKISHVLIFTGLVFIGCLSQDYIQYDDPAHIFSTKAVAPLTLEIAREAFLDYPYSTFIPLSTLSFSIQERVIGIHPSTAKLINLALHLINVYLIYRLALIFGLGQSAAILAALLFGVHPMRVESVAWATERKDVLFMIFYLLAIKEWVKYLKNGAGEGYILTLCYGGLAILAKPMALSLPWALMIVEVYRTGRTRWLNKIPFALALWPVAAVTWLGSSSAMGFEWDSALFMYPWSATTYLTKAFFPVNIHPLYAGPDMPFGWLHTLFVIGLAGAWTAWGVITKDRGLKMGLAFYAGTIFFFWRGQNNLMDPVADRFIYLPCIFLCMWTAQKIMALPKNTRALPVILVLALSLKTISIIPIWTNNDTFYDHALAKNPALSDFWSHRGVNMENEGRDVLAEGHYTKAIEGCRDYDACESFYENRGFLLARLGRYEEALSDFAYLSYAPYENEVMAWSGYSMMKLEEYNEAIKYYVRAIELDPTDATSHFNLGRCLSEIGRASPALKHFEIAIKENIEEPWHTESRINIEKIKQYQENRKVSRIEANLIWQKEGPSFMNINRTERK